MVHISARWPLMLFALLLCPAMSFGEQVPSRIVLIPTPPPPGGQRITAGNGDTIVIDADARVRIVRRRPTFVRVVADLERRFVVVVVEHLQAAGGTPRRIADWTYTFSALEGQWPFATRWEGQAWFEEHLGDGNGRSRYALETAEGAVLFFDSDWDNTTSQGTPATSLRAPVTRNEGSESQAFDEAEKKAVQTAIQHAARQTPK